MYSFCCICGEQNDIEMHHLKSLKNLRCLTKDNKTTFNKILIQLNRKQIPVCKTCHVKITAGKYSGMSLANLFSESLASL